MSRTLAGTPLESTIGHLIRKRFEHLACEDCDVVWPWACIEFDHIVPRKGELCWVTKRFHNRAYYKKSPNQSTKSLLWTLEQIGKCRRICANCHNIRTDSENLQRSGKPRTFTPAQAEVLWILRRLGRTVRSTARVLGLRERLAARAVNDFHQQRERQNEQQREDPKASGPQGLDHSA